VLWAEFDMSAAAAVPVRRARTVDSAVRHRVLRRHRRPQPDAAGADRLPDADRAAVGWESIDKKIKEFSIFMLLLEASMIGVFCALDIFLFYVFWDFVLIPMYFLIGIWGYDQRIYAAVKFILYTMAGSVLMLIAIIGLSWVHQARPGSTASTC
jgi:hypothetical protein